MAAAQTPQFVLMLISLLALMVSAAPQEQAPGQAQGVTVPVDRGLQSKLGDARELLQGEQSASAIAILQEVLEADGGALIATDDPNLARGASVEAAEILASLGDQSAEQRNQLVKRYGTEKLAEALYPPDTVRLQQLAQQYAGTEVGEAAYRALQELALDRGYLAPKRIDRWVPTLPFYTDAKDPALPLVEANGLRPLWRYDFSEDSPYISGGSHRMAFGEGLGFVSDGIELTALNLGKGSVEWRYDSTPGWNDQSLSAKEDLAKGANSDTLTVPVIEDGIVLAVLQEAGGVGRFDEFNRHAGRAIPVRRRLPARRLHAFDALTGRLLWKQDVPWTSGDNSEPRGLVAAPPAVANGRVFLPIYDAVGTIDLSMMALDLYTGKKLWKTFIVSGQQETNLFGNILREMACQPPAADADKVLFCSNLGTISALDAESGRTLWTRLYERAEVDTYQNGMEARRQSTFANGFPAYDGDRFLCAPRDGIYAFLVSAKDGLLIKNWIFSSGNYGTLRNLVGTTKTGAWFHGTRMVYLPFPGTADTLQVSHQMFSEGGVAENRHPAALARGEILAQSIGALEILSAVNLRSKSLVQNVGSRNTDRGAVQTAPGLAFIMRRNGVTALSSPDAILNSLLASNLDEVTLNRLLPYLEGIDLSDVATARRLANRTRDLAAKAPSNDLAERLKLIAARSLMVTEEGADSLPLLNQIMQSSRKSRRFKAAVLALDVLEKTNPAHPMMDRVLGLIEDSERSHITRNNGRRESKDIVLARARVLQGGQRGFGSNSHLNALMQLMELPKIEAYYQGTLNLQQWGRLQLQNMLIDDSASKKLEARARQEFAEGEVDDVKLLKFAGTETAWKWLQKQATAIGDNRLRGLQVAGWLRNFDWPQQDQQPLNLDVDMLLGIQAPGQAPAALNIVRSFELSHDGNLIDVYPLEDGARLLVKEGASVRMIDLLRERRVQTPAVKLASDPRSMPELRNRAFAHAEGGTVIADQAWVKLYLDGNHDVLPLPGQVTRIHRVDGLIALLCRKDDQIVILQVRDLISGTLVLDMKMPLTGGRYHQIRSKGETLLVMEQAKAQAFQAQLFSSRELSLLPLPSVPGTRDLDYTLALDDGYVLPFLRGRQNYNLRVLDGESDRTIGLPRKSSWITFQAPSGIGWLIQSYGPNRGEYPTPVVSWMGYEMSSELPTAGPLAEMRFPQLDSHGRIATKLSTDALISYGEDDRGKVVLHQWKLNVDGPAELQWSLPLEDLSFNDLVTRLPAPSVAEDGWLLPLKFGPTNNRNARVVNLLVSTDGQLLDRFELEAPTKYSHYVRSWMLDQMVVLRHESKIYLLGEER
jgi:outer membrane protein assembly factor BamB